MSQTTSQTVINRMRESGMKSKLQLLVVEALATHGPMTQVETWKQIPGFAQSSITPRFSTLSAFGVVEPKGKRRCNVTGEIVLVWGLTGRTPSTFERPIPLKVQLRRAEARIVELEAALHRRRDDNGRFATETGAIRDDKQITLL